MPRTGISISISTSTRVIPCVTLTDNNYNHSHSNSNYNLTTTRTPTTNTITVTNNDDDNDNAKDNNNRARTESRFKLIVILPNTRVASSLYLPSSFSRCCLLSFHPLIAPSFLFFPSSLPPSLPPSLPLAFYNPRITFGEHLPHLLLNKIKNIYLVVICPKTFNLIHWQFKYVYMCYYMSKRETIKFYEKIL